MLDNDERSARQRRYRLACCPFLKVSSGLFAFSDSDARVRKAALAGLVKQKSKDLDEIDKRLLPEDPFETISDGRIRTMAHELDLSEAKVRQRYKRLSEMFGLKVEPPATNP